MAYSMCNVERILLVSCGESFELALRTTQPPDQDTLFDHYNVRLAPSIVF